MKNLILILLMLIISPAYAQLKMTELKTQVWTGFDNPVLGSNGELTTGPDSKPVVKLSTKYAFDAAIPYKFYRLKVERIPLGEKIAVEKAPDSETYWFRSGATAGKYKFAYDGFDPEKGFIDDEWIVDYNPSTPPPVGPVDPVIPDDILNGLSLESNKIFNVFTTAMANDMRTIAQEIKAGKIKTMLELGARGNVLDLATRTNFKMSMGKVLQPLLGDAVLPQNADLIMLQVATGFEGK
jgi:hypothetical protein